MNSNIEQSVRSRIFYFKKQATPCERVTLAGLTSNLQATDNGVAILCKGKEAKLWIENISIGRGRNINIKESKNGT